MEKGIVARNIKETAARNMKDATVRKMTDTVSRNTTGNATRDERETATKNTNKSLALEASTGKRFFLNDGRSLGTIMELQNALGNMDNSVFKHHVTTERNDFSNWIKDVFNETTLAGKVAKMENRFNMKETIEKYISEGKGDSSCSRY
ncbi:MAG: hypothetical protein WC614_10370 [bacterium]